MRRVLKCFFRYDGHAGLKLWGFLSPCNRRCIPVLYFDGDYLTLSILWYKELMKISITIFSDFGSIDMSKGFTPKSQSRNTKSRRILLILQSKLSNLNHTIPAPETAAAAAAPENQSPNHHNPNHNTRKFQLLILSTNAGASAYPPHHPITYSLTPGIPFISTSFSFSKSLNFFIAASFLIPLPTVSPRNISATKA